MHSSLYCAGIERWRWA